jgi:glycosyltransferase involved in cell wall biosynthesis
MSEISKSTINVKPKRVLLICAISPRFMATISVTTTRFVRAILDAGWEVDILGFRGKKHRPDDFFSKLVEGAKIYERGGFLGRPSIWVYSAVKMGANLIAKRSYNLLISIAMPTWSHVVALFLKKMSNLPWIAFFSDPWSNSPELFPDAAIPISLWRSMFRRFHHQNAVRRFIERRLERQTLYLSDALIFTNHHLQDWVLNQYPNREEIDKKCFAIPYFFDPQLRPSARSEASVAGESGTSESAARCGKFIIRHMGRIPDVSDAGSLFRAFRMLLTEAPSTASRVVFEFYGGHKEHPLTMSHKDLIRQLSLQEYVVFHNGVSYKENLNLICEADALLFLGFPPHSYNGMGNVILHTKMPDYLGSGKPIFALAGAGSPAHEALRGTNGMCVSGEPLAIKAALAKFLENPELPDPVVRESFSKESVFPQWEEVFDRLLRQT